MMDNHLYSAMVTRCRRQSRMVILSTKVDKKSLKTEFFIAIYRQIGNKWQSKTLFLANIDQRSLVVQSVFDCRLPGVMVVY